ncbi:zinc finger protein Pegasus [Elysia marginata]|uniref:Zinc finger protein Pegasus n=1 Tax=Elysia marginata TaxID=1093978 RepID=A0AAV4J4X8_9GAST|nr:zinc finger protein Pegasus [Elysia marginata]
MSEERVTPHEVSPQPDSISNLDSLESVNRCSPVVTAVPNSTQMPTVGAENLNLEPHVDSPLLPDSSPECNAAERVLKNSSHCTERAPLPIAPSDLLLSGSSTSAFRPFITHTSAQPTAPACSSSIYSGGQPLTSTPVSRRSERSSTMPGVSPFTSLQSFAQSSSPQDSLHQEESSTVVINSNINDENDDGRTTASAPPCTPAPEPHQQPQSPFRNNRQIKKIDLLAMSRSRQSDRAENARRDGRLAPSPRKKDEVLRNSGFTFPAGRGFGCPPNLRHTMHDNTNLPLRSEVSPERAANRSSSTASPNVDVVSVDEPQSDPTKCTLSIQFQNFSPAEQMLKCNLCGFVTNNPRFYRRHRRIHNRQCQPNLIQCSLCDYSTTQIRKMREHTISHHHMSHPQNSSTIAASGSGAGSCSSSSQNLATGAILDVNASHLQPHLQGHVMVSGRGEGNSTNFILPLTGPQPINLGPSTAIAPPPQAPTAQPAASSLGLPTYIPAPLDGVGPPPPPPPHPSSSNLQHPSRSSNVLGNYTSERQQQDMASYMQSVLSNLITPSHTNPGSSATSTGLLMQVAGGRHLPAINHQNPSLTANSTHPIEENYNFRRFWNNNGSSTFSNAASVSMGHTFGSNGFLKIKTEPVQTNHHHHVVSRSAQNLPSSTQKMQQSRRGLRRQSDALDSESGMDMSSDDPASSPQPPPLQRPRLDTHISNSNPVSNPITTSSIGVGDAHNLVQSSSVSGVGTQCPMPFIKIEFPPHREPCSFNHGNFSNTAGFNERGTAILVDREIQCEIISATSSPRAGAALGGGSRHVGGRTQSETVSSAGGGGATTAATRSSASGVDTKCYYCGVTFDDEVLFSIHIGCHSHTDPFTCNVCGKQCYNKYGFYSHIMRGHQARPST